MRSGPLFLAALAGLAACSPASDVPVAERGVAAFHAALDSGRYAAIYAASSDEMKRTTSAEDFGRLLAAVHDRFGRFRAGSTRSWNDSRTTSGRFVTLDYAATYERGTAEENFVFRIDDDRAALAGYHVDSRALVEPSAQPAGRAIAQPMSFLEPERDPPLAWWLWPVLLLLCGGAIYVAITHDRALEGLIAPAFLILAAIVGLERRRARRRPDDLNGAEP
ncbi:MAG: hypothetical protein QOJ94_1233 [Sphingomonadales bacterium]|jgi:hypothetical protein|nr:hypothetical protein [Sphingomonadales bacterium]